jgi:hypothetical protein
MKSKTLLYTLIGTLALAIILWIYFATQTVVNDTVFKASVNRDCAPWDGMAYTITIPYRASSVINVSIWQAPDFHFPATYSFPDSSSRVGTAIYLSRSDSAQSLNGKITLQPFEVGSPIHGRFNFTSEDGEQFKGSFKAEWGNQIALCG